MPVTCKQKEKPVWSLIVHKCFNLEVKLDKPQKYCPKALGGTITCLYLYLTSTLLNLVFCIQHDIWELGVCVCVCAL